MTGLTATSLLKVIRKHCLVCSGNSYKSIRHCSNEVCNLWEYRLGVNPNVSDAKKEAGRKAYLNNLADISRFEIEPSHHEAQFKDIDVM